MSVTVRQVGATHEVIVHGLSRDEADGLAETLRAYITELESGPTHAEVRP